MTPNYAIYRQSYITCLSIGKTFDYLPKAGEEYPFIYIQKVPTENENETKDLTGTATQTIKIFARREQSATADNMAAELRNKLLTQRKAFEYSLSRNSVSIQPMDADAQNEQVDQYIIRYVTRYSKKER
jgi:hypothetical protein